MIFKRNKFKRLAKKVRKYTKNSDKIGVAFSENSLELYLDLDIGFNGYEQVKLIPDSGNLNFYYSAMCDKAKNTFLDERYSRYFSESPVLFKIKAELLGTKSYASGHSLLFKAEEKNISYDEAEAIINFFIESFKSR